MDQLPPELRGAFGYGGYIALAFAGSFMRASKWRDDATGKVIWWRVLTEIPVSIAVGSVAVGIGTYYQFSPAIIGGICGLLGLLGPAFFTSAGDAIIAIAKHKLGGG